MTTAKGYTEMKDSGIEWVGMIPNHWTTIANKYVMHKEKHICEKWDGQDVLSLTMNGVIIRDILNPVGKMPTTFDGYQFAYAGELLMCLFDIDVTPRCVGRVFNDGVTSPAYSCFQLNDNADLGYFYYYYLMVDNTKELLHLAKNLRHSFTEEQLGQLKVPLPPLQEQSAIASYLDTQCAKIDEIIAQAKASIEDYKQWKASIIYEAVTKGLDPNVEMKDSGIEWIGRMPAHWTAPALKHLCTMQAGKNLISEQISTSGQYPVYGGNGQRGYYSDYNANGNFLLVGRQGALCGNVHYVSGKFWATEHAVVTTPSKITNIRYLYYLLIAMDLNQYASNSAAQPGLSVGNILTVKTLLPPIGEQVRISEFLDNGCPKIDEVITEKQSLIDDLESYKKSLIYEVVTGKRRVY